MDIEQIKKQFGLEPLPEEGGFFRRTYSCSHKAKIDRGERNFGDAIYYLITPDQFSKLHKLKLDEMWHFYAGDPIEMVQLKDNKLELFELGNSDFSKHKPQVLVPANTWQGARLKKGGKFALVGTNGFPAYEHEDFEIYTQEFLDSLPSEIKEICLSYV